MERPFDRLARETFDVLVIGGGILGTGVARDAARRGLRVALVEKEDLGYGTTGRSTRLVHGGIRYLELLDFGLVRESLRERERLLQNAPHLVHPMEFLVPIYKGVTPSRLKMRAGLVLYDLLSYDKTLPNHGFLSAREAREREPGLSPEGLRGAAIYHDAQVPHVERLCVENALDAAAHGAVVLNHAEVVDLLRDRRPGAAGDPKGVGAGDRVVGARVRDRLGQRDVEARARVVVNATGPWLDEVLGLVDPESPPRLRTTKGIHLVVPSFVDEAVVLFATDGRLFFAIPWNGQTLVGTTDTDYRADLDAVHADEEDLAYLRRSLHRFFPDADLSRVHYTYAGVRSLLRVEGVAASDVSRRHLVLDHGGAQGVGGLVSIVGGKITPHRAIAEEVVDLVARKLDRQTRGDTVDAPLPGAIETTPDAYVAERVDDVMERTSLPRESAEHVLRLYGRRHGALLERARDAPDLLRPICPHAPDIWAQVVFAVEDEMARTTADVLLRRTTVGLAPCEGLHVADEVAAYLGKLQGWSHEAVERDAAAYRAEVAERRVPGEDAGPARTS